MISTTVKFGQNKFLLEMEDGQPAVAYYYNNGQRGFTASKKITMELVDIFNKRSKEGGR